MLLTNYHPCSTSCNLKTRQFYYHVACVTADTPNITLKLDTVEMGHSTVNAVSLFGWRGLYLANASLNHYLVLINDQDQDGLFLLV